MRFRSVLVICAGITFLPAAALGEDWVKVYEGQGYTNPKSRWRTLYDRDSVTTVGNGFRKVWVKAICLANCPKKDDGDSSKTHQLSFMLYDCEQRTQMVESGQNFWSDETATKLDPDKEPEAVPPGYMNDKVLKAVCDE